MVSSNSRTYAAAAALSSLLSVHFFTAIHAFMSGLVKGDSWHPTESFGGACVIDHDCFFMMKSLLILMQLKNYERVCSSFAQKIGGKSQCKGDKSQCKGGKSQCSRS